MQETSRYFMELAYDGTNYHGWQKQPHSISVQEVIEDGLKKMLREDIRIQGAGRTDTGVHAAYMVAGYLKTLLSMISSQYRKLHTRVFMLQSVPTNTIFY